MVLIKYSYAIIKYLSTMLCTIFTTFRIEFLTYVFWETFVPLFYFVEVEFLLLCSFHVEQKTLPWHYVLSKRPAPLIVSINFSNQQKEKGFLRFRIFRESTKKKMSLDVLKMVLKLCRTLCGRNHRCVFILVAMFWQHLIETRGTIFTERVENFSPTLLAQIFLVLRKKFYQGRKMAMSILLSLRLSHQPEILK